MSEWKAVKLKDVVSILGDGLHGTPIYNNIGEYFFINGNNLSEGHIVIKNDTKRVDFLEYDKYKKDLNDRTLLVSINGTIGNVATYKGEKCMLGKSACYFNILPGVCKEYIYYILLHDNFQSYAKNWATGTTIKNVSLKQMREYEFLLPSFEKQQQIAKILSSLDDKIELNAQINHNLLKEALTLYAAHFASQDKNGCIGDYCSVRSGFAFKSSWWVDKGVKVIKIGSISQDNLNLLECSHVDEDKIERASDFKVGAGDLLIAMTGATIGKFTMVPHCSEPLLVNQRVGKFFLGNNPVEKLPFIYCTLKQPDIYNEIVNRGQGSAQPNISAIDIMNIPCVIPSIDNLTTFNNTCQPLFDLIISNQRESQQLSEIRDSLLPKLMSGEIDVSEVEV